MITKFSENKSNKSNNEYYNLETIFEKFILLYLSFVLQALEKDTRILNPSRHF